MRQYAAEFLGTFWLVLGGCGSAVLAAAFPGLGIGLLGVSLAFGLTVLTMAFAIGHISGCHLNPAVSVGLWAGGRFPASKLAPYIVAQVLGAVVAGGVLYVIASGAPGFDVSKGFASNGYAAHSPGGYSLLAGADLRGGHDHVLSAGHSRRHRPARACGLCTHRHRAGADLDPPRQHPGDEHFGQPGAQHGCCALCRRLGAWPAMAVLARAHRRCLVRRRGLSIHRPRGGLNTSSALPLLGVSPKSLVGVALAVARKVTSASCRPG